MNNMTQNMPKKDFDIDEFCQSGAIFSLNKDYLAVGIGSPKWKKFDDLDVNTSAFYSPDFFLEQNSPWVQFDKNFEFKTTDFQKIIAAEQASKKLEWQNPYRDLFYKNFEKLNVLFVNETLIKAVPYAFSFTEEKMSKNQFLISLESGLEILKNFPIHLYGWWTNNEGLLGATPELLFEYKFINEPLKLKTCAVAGTRTQNTSLFDFKERNKEMLEHTFVIHGIKAAFCELGNIIISDTEVLNFPNLSHLKTNIEINLFKEEMFENIVQTIHPTPALGAYPKKEGLVWLKEYQKVLPRGRFGAPIGILFPSERIAKCVVAIRNIQWNNQGMAIGAGCGVIKESVCEDEWQEISLKMKSIQDLFKL